MMKKQLKEMLEKAIDDALNDDGKKKPGQGQPVEVPGMPAKPGQKGKPQGKPMQVPKGMLEDIAKDLKDKLDALAEKYKSMSQRDEDDKRRRGQKVEGGRPQGRGPDFFDMLRDAARNLAQQQKAGKCAGVGTKYGVPPEVVAEYFEIRDRRAGVIEQLTEELTEPFRDNRRSIIRHNKREGNWTPGLEGETVGEMMSGNLEPETMMKQDENPDFAKTEVEFVVDTSGSMGGGPLRACREMQVVAMESLEGVRDRLAGEDLLRPKQEIPLKMGSCMLDSEYHPIHNKDEDLDEHAKIHIVHILSTAGGGTDVHHTTEKKYQEFNTGDPNTIKIMVLMSDHFTEATTMAKLVEQIRRDNTIIFLALGFGSDAESIAKIYGDAAAEAGATNVFAKAFPENEIESATPWVARFLVDQVTPRVEQMTSKFRGY